MLGWLGLTSHRQRGHLETVPPFTVPCEGRKAQFLHHSKPGIKPRGSPLHNHYTTPDSVYNVNVQVQVVPRPYIVYP